MHGFYVNKTIEIYTHVFSLLFSPLGFLSLFSFLSLFLHGFSRLLFFCKFYGALRPPPYLRLIAVPNFAKKRPKRQAHTVNPPPPPGVLVYHPFLIIWATFVPLLGLKIFGNPGLGSLQLVHSSAALLLQ